MQIKLLLDGNRMAVKPLTPRLSKRLEESLHYVKTEFLRGEEARFARTKMRFTPIDCFRYSRGRLITNAGFIERVKKIIRELGHQPLVKDLSANTRPERWQSFPNLLRRAEMRYRQEEVLKTCDQHPRCRIDCFTGYGKSYLMRHAIRYWKRAKIAIVTPGADTARDMYEALREEQGGIGCYGGGVTVKGSRVQIYCVSSLHRSQFDEDIVLADEIQEYATDKRLEQLARFENAKMIGLSASHNARNDNADLELEALFGHIAMKIDYQEGVKQGLATPIHVRWVPVVMDEDPCEEYEDTTKERWGIWRNKFRNRLVRDVAREFKDEQVLIVVKSIEHMVFLKKLLPEFTMVHAENAMSGDDRYKYVKWRLLDEDEPVMTLARRHLLKKQFEAGELRKVIVNNVWNRGVNFHQLSVLIRADAAGSKIADIQIPGRLSRLHEDKPSALLVDFMDQFNKGFRRKAQGRERNYREKGWPQTFPQPKSRFLQQRIFT